MANQQDMDQPRLAFSQKTDTLTSFPGLDAVGDRTLKSLHNMLAHFGCRSVTVDKGDTEILSAAAWRTRNSASAICWIAPIAFKGSFAFAMEPDLIVRLVDVFYGGTGDTTPYEGNFRQAEVRMIARIGAYWVNALPSVWREVHDNQMQYALMVGDEQTRSFARGAKLVVQNYRVTGLGSEPLSVCWAYPLDILRLMPVLAEAEPTGPSPVPDPVWQAQIKQAVMGVSLPVRTIFARPEVPLSRLLVLKPGDIIPVHLPATVPVTIAGRVFAEGTVGESSGRTAIRISRIAEGVSFHD
jgi:flagellar motor switch protein FliM